MSASPLNSIEEAIFDLSQGKLIIVVDDEDRENEGDFVGLAEKATPEMLNMMVTYGKGMVCVPLTKERQEQLKLPLMVQENTAPLQTAFTITVDYREHLTTGISCNERAETVKALANPQIKFNDFCTPGHIFPLLASAGGVLQRAGHTEAAVDLARLCQAAPVGVICEILKENGECARLPDLQKLSSQFNLKIISIKDLIAYRKRSENLFSLKKSSEIPFPTRYGDFRLHLYESLAEGSGEYHLALTKGDIGGGDPHLVRVHSECFSGDIFGSLRCDCGDQLARSLQLIEAEGRGVLLYLKQEGRGIGAANKIKAYALQDLGHDTITANEALGFGADLRSYEVGVLILKDLGIKKIRLLTNNPAKVEGMSSDGLEVIERVSLEVPPNKTNLHYLMTKKECMGHYLSFH